MLNSTLIPEKWRYRLMDNAKNPYKLAEVVTEIKALHPAGFYDVKEKNIVYKEYPYEN
jgi:hypothetical protein